MRNNLHYNAYQTNIDTIERAVKERLFYVKDGEGRFVNPTRPETSTTFSRSFKDVYDFFSKVTRPVSPLTKDQFLGAYEGRRKITYEKAMRDLLQRPLARKDADIKFFPKIEKLNFTEKPNAVPRGISPRDPRYHVTLGPYIKRIEHLVYAQIDKMFEAPTIMKGKNMLQRGKILRQHWQEFSDPVAIGIDAKRFDQHVSYQALEFEHSIYKLFFPRDKLFDKLLRSQLINKGNSYCYDGKLKFVLKGCRMSGDMNTALGNCLLMATMIYHVCRQNKLPKFRVVIDGDDAVIICEQKNLSKLQNIHPQFLKFGFDIVVEQPVTVFEQIEFCQSQPIWTTNGYVMCRDRKCFAKDTTSILPLNTELLAKRWTRSIGLCGLSLNSGIPIAQEFYQAFVRCSEGVQELKGDPTQETGMKMMAKGMDPKYKPIEPQTRYSYWLAFGIEPAKQLIYEQMLRDKVIDHKVTIEHVATMMHF